MDRKVMVMSRISFVLGVSLTIVVACFTFFFLIIC
jgi:hypothetical protein